MLSFGFPPLSLPSAQVLILGSLPGRLSLERGQYYANPQNAFSEDHSRPRAQLAVRLCRARPGPHE
jgi:hypothetical protein